MTDRDALLVLLGAILGFTSAVGAEYVRRLFDRADRWKRAMGLLSAVVGKVEEGISRCDYLVNLKQEQKLSFSRIYTALWESMTTELSLGIGDLKAPEALTLLHRIYYRFDLIDFNMDRNEFGTGAAFAEHYLHEMQENCSKVREIVGTLNARALSAKQSAIGWHAVSGRGFPG